MTEHELPPMRGTLLSMSRLRAFAPVAGAAAAFGTLGAMPMAAALLIGVLATFIAFAGLLMVSDGQADAQSRHEWAQIGLTPTHVSVVAEPIPAGSFDARYLASESDEALRHLFLAHLAPAQTTCSLPAPERSVGFQSAQLASDNVSAIGSASEADASERASPKAVGTRTAITKTVSRKGRHQKKVIAAQVRLVANGDAWPRWAARIGPAAQGTAEVVVLSAGHDDRAQPQPETSIDAGNAESTEPVSLHNTTDNSDASAPRWVGCRVVTDDLGPKIPITHEELDAIETYLEADLRKLFSSRKSGGLQQDI